MMVTSVDVLLDEPGIVQLILEYLSSHGLLVSMLTLERETGIVNGKYSNEGHFLRQLILDGQWNDVLSFVQPLSSIATFDMKQLLYIIQKQRYLEMLSIKSDLHPENHRVLVEEMVKCAAGLEKICPSKTDYDNLCVLLTLSSLCDHVDYKNWNMLSARLECFEKIHSLIAEFLPIEECSAVPNVEVGTHRLINLLVKGLLYESCSEFCLSRATANLSSEFHVSSLLTNVTLSDSDLCLVSWLTVLPPEVFSYSFERKSLKLNRKTIIRPDMQWNDYLRNPLNLKLSLISSLSSSSMKSSTLSIDKKDNTEMPCLKSLPSSSSYLQTCTANSCTLFGNLKCATALDQLFRTSRNLEGKKSQKSISVRNVSSHERNEAFANIDKKDIDNEPYVQLPYSQRRVANPVFQILERPSSVQRGNAENVGRDRDKGGDATTKDFGSDKTDFDETPAVKTPLKLANKNSVPKFVELIKIEDPQVIRTAAFHPHGHLYAVGSNSRILRVCRYPSGAEIKEMLRRAQGGPESAAILYTSAKLHRGSIYCVSWNQSGSLIATGSNDKTIRVAKFSQETSQAVGKDIEILCHDGTVRDLIFVGDVHLVSGGAGDCKVYVTDCETGKTVQTLAGHKGHIFSLHGWERQMVVSGSQDGTACIWDMRSSSPVSIVHSLQPGSAFASVAVDTSGRLLASGHEDSTCMLWDIRKSLLRQSFKPHTSDIRSVRFSPDGLLLLTASYDQTVKIMDLSSDVSDMSTSVIVAQHKDKVIQCRWHPTQGSFVTTSVDRSVGCWIPLDYFSTDADLE